MIQDILDKKYYKTFEINFLNFLPEYLEQLKTSQSTEIKSSARNSHGFIEEEYVNQLK
jgi:hypothetical protein